MPGTEYSHCSAATATRMRSETASASYSVAPGSTRMNSSPPVRANRSPERTTLDSSAATLWRIASPAWWPCVSLTALNPSRSSTAIIPSPSTSDRNASRRRRFGRPVRSSVFARSAQPAAARRNWSWSTSAAADAR
nr:hypothetical protein [Glycomyces paridis]